jgi:predicted O-methyltransferase YrrM
MTPASGPLFERLDTLLREAPAYADFRAGRLSPSGFADFLDSRRGDLVAGGVPDEDVDYAKRYPADRHVFVRSAMERLCARGVLPAADYDFAAWQAAEGRLRGFDHGGRTTYIYPEEAELLFAIASVWRPRRALFLGSYYGFWAAAAIPALTGGTAVLVDPDEGCCALARSNFAAEIEAGTIEIACTTGEQYLAGPQPDRFDMVVIDAELPRDHPVAELRGKGVYASLLAAALPHLAGRAVLVCHNILLRDWTGAPVFERILSRNGGELAAFEALARTHFANWTEIDSTEGVGVGSRAPEAGQ